MHFNTSYVKVPGSLLIAAGLSFTFQYIICEGSGVALDIDMAYLQNFNTSYVKVPATCRWGVHPKR